MRESVRMLSLSCAGRIAPTTGDNDSVQSNPQEDTSGGEPPAGGGEYLCSDMPVGTHVMFNILSTWGRESCCGLTALQLFSATGELISLAPQNVLCDVPEVASWKLSPDPSVLVLDHPDTRDPTRMFLAPFVAGADHIILVTLPSAMKLSAVRVWNYNHSRVHSSRGVRLLEITCDDDLVFRGEVRQASGSTQDIANNYETILFTSSEEALRRIAASLPPVVPHLEAHPSQGQLPVLEDESGYLRRSFIAPRATVLPPSPTKIGSTPITTVEFRIISNWGHLSLVGLSGVLFLDMNGAEVDVATVQMDPLPAAHEHTCELSALTDADPNTAWVAPASHGNALTLTFTFRHSTRLSAIQVANYGLPPDTHIGVKNAAVYFDGTLVTPPDGACLRKAPLHRKGIGQTLFYQTFDVSGVTIAANQRGGSCFSVSLGASATLRAKVAIRRSRLFGIPAPAWLLDVQLCETPLIPVGYVLTVTAAAQPPMPDSTAKSLVDKVEIMDEDGEVVHPSDQCVCGEQEEERGMSIVYLLHDSPIAVGLVRITWSEACPVNKALSVHITMDDAILFSGTMAVTPNGMSSLVAFTTDEKLLSRFMDQLLANAHARNAVLEKSEESPYSENSSQ